MKKNISIVLALLAFALIGCEKNTPYEPGKPSTTSQVVYFPLSAELAQEMAPEDSITSHDFVIARLDSSKAETIHLSVISNTDNAFTVPDTVNFAAGVGHRVVTAKFNEMKVGTTYSFSVRISADDINSYFLDTVNAGAIYSPIYSYEVTPIKYTYGTGVFVDNPVLALILSGADGTAWTADYKYADTPSGIRKFIIMNLYTTPATALDPETGLYTGCPFTNIGLTVDDSQDYNFFLYIDGKGVVTMDNFDLGLIYPGVGMCSVQNYKGNVSKGEFDEDLNAIVFDQAASSNNTVFYVATYAQNYAGFLFFLSIEDFVKATAEEATAPAAAPARKAQLTAPITNANLTK